MSIYNKRNFLHFLKNGELGVLRPKKSLEEVLELLGEPNYVGDRSERLVNLFYNNLIIAFYDEMLIMVEIQFRKEKGNLPKSLGIDWYEAVQQVTFDAFINFLKDQKIRCKRLVSEFDNDVGISLWVEEPVEKVGAGIEFRFYTETGEIGEIIYDLDPVLGKKQRLVEI